MRWTVESLLLLLLLGDGAAYRDRSENLWRAEGVLEDHHRQTSHLRAAARSAQSGQRQLHHYTEPYSGSRSDLPKSSWASPTDPSASGARHGTWESTHHVYNLNASPSYSTKGSKYYKGSKSTKGSHYGKGGLSSWHSGSSKSGGKGSYPDGPSGSSPTGGKGHNPQWPSGSQYQGGQGHHPGWHSGSSKGGGKGAVPPAWPSPSVHTPAPVTAPTRVTEAPVASSAPVATETPSTASVPTTSSTSAPQALPDFLPDFSLNRFSEGTETHGDVVLDEFTAASSPMDWVKDFHLTNVELQMIQNAEENQASIPVTTQQTTNTCALGSTGFYGSPTGSVYDITFIYQAILTDDANQFILRSEVAPALDVGVPEALLPIFFSECAGRRRLQMMAPSIEGISRMQTDFVVADPNLCAGAGAGANCYVFSGSINVFGSNFFTLSDVENVVLPAIQRVMQSGQLLALSPYIERVTYLEQGLVTGNPVPTVAPQPAQVPQPSAPVTSPVTDAPNASPSPVQGTPSSTVPPAPTLPSPTLASPTTLTPQATATPTADTPAPGVGTSSPSLAEPSEPTEAPVALTPAPGAPTPPSTDTLPAKSGVARVPWWGWIFVALGALGILLCVYLAVAEDDRPRNKPSSSDMHDRDGEDASYEPPGGDVYVPPGGDSMDTSAFRVPPPNEPLGVVQENGETQENFQYGEDDEEGEENYDEETYEEGEGDEEEGDDDYEEGEDDEEYEDGEEYEEGDEDYEEGEEEDEDYEDDYDEGEEEPVSYGDEEDEEEDEGSYYEEETMETPDENDGQRQWR